MKKITILLLIAMVLFACNNEGSKESTKDSTGTTEKKDAASANPDYQKGLALVADPNNACLTCHRVDETLTGPPYRAVANKYAGASDSVENYLVHKVINGGSGVWGQVPMPPHPGLSEADAKAMVKYILLLKQ